jgi:glycosyltransferase involved in cell wall biosynthesis
MISRPDVDIIYRSNETRCDIGVSVITPAFNPSSDLAVAVASLNNQTVRNFEWILVDDASAEDCTGHIHDARNAATFPLTILRHQRTARQGQARNTGLLWARGSFVKFLDADDALDPTHLERLQSAARGALDERRIVFAPTRHLFVTNGKVVDNNTYRGLPDDSHAQLARILTEPFMHHCGALFPRSLLEELGGYNPALVTDEDGDLLLRVLLKGWRFQAAPEIRYLYRHHRNSPRVSHDDTMEKILARKRVGESVLAHYAVRDEQLPQAIRSALCRRLDALAVRNWRTWPAEARQFLAEARALDVDYRWSGSRLERFVRSFAGIGAANSAISAIRTIRAIVNI